MRLRLGFALALLSAGLSYGQESNLMDQRQRISAHSIRSWTITLPENRQVSLQVIVRNNQRVGFYWIDPDDAENFNGFPDSVYHLQEFYGAPSEGGFNETACLRGGEYVLSLVNFGDRSADCRVIIDTSDAPAGAEVLEIRRPRTGNIGRGNGAGRYRLCVTAYTASEEQSQNGDLPWDADGSPPDVQFQLYDVAGDGISDVEQIVPEHPRRNLGHGRSEPGDETAIACWEFDWDGHDDVNLVAWDKDLGGWELIGAAAIDSGNEPGRARVTLRGNSQRYQAVGSIMVELSWRKLR